MTKETSFQIIKDAFSSLHRSGILEQDIEIEESTVVLGAGSPLDSIGFVMFVTDLEDRISSLTDKEIYLVLSEIHEFNIDNQYLTVGKLADYIIYAAAK